MNIFKYIFVSIVFVTGITAAAAQTYPIPDPKLRAKLISDYPSVMNANGELIIAAAKGLSTDLNLDNLGITNADGLQFFESTGIIRLRNNALTGFPQLSTMKGARRVYISNNFLTSVPDLSALYQLIDLFVANNNLSSLPAIQGKATLQYVTCSGNNISALPDLSALVNLKTLVVSFNPIASLPDLTSNVNLETLDIRNTNINSIPSLPALINLEVLNCENSFLTDLSGLNSNTVLRIVTAQNNAITTLPDFSNKPSVTSVNLSDNKLTFEDLLPLASLPAFSAFTYSPQKDLSIPLFVELREQNVFTYQVPIDPSITTNQFTWSKNGVPAVTNSTGSYTFNPVVLSDSGTYAVTVRNAALPGLILKSNPSALTVRTCIDISHIQVSILSTDCREGMMIDLAGTTVEGAVAPITYIVRSANPVKVIPNPTALQFGKARPGKYVLTVTDSRNCATFRTFVINRDSECENVFSPNGDGIMDTYFIPETGTAQIYNTSRTLIKTLDLPAAWDGTTSTGAMADAGYYVIVINGVTTVGVSLFR